MPYAHSIQYSIIGDQGVGKTCLQLQFTDNTFQTVYEATNDIEYGTRTITVDNKRIKLQIWDTAGKGVYKPLIRQYYAGVGCIILVYDITRRDTFNHIAKWLEEARTFSRADAVLVLIGNKCDMSNARAVSYEEGKNFAEEHNLVFMEASAKTAENVEEIFIRTTKTICKMIEDGALHLCNKSIDLLRLPDNITLSKSVGVAGSSCEGGERKRETREEWKEEDGSESIVKRTKK